MAIKNRICICCGTEYKYCPSCTKDRYKPTWYALYCSENCKTIFDAANDYGFGLKTKEEAKAIIENCDLTNLESFKEIVKNDVNKIIEVVEPKKADAPKKKPVKHEWAE